jgi:hypothetical protein
MNMLATMAGPLWNGVSTLARHKAENLTKQAIPATVGVYVWFRDGSPVYSGRALGAGGLRDRIWKYHLSTGRDLSRSAFRRNVCEYLGIADTHVTRLRPARLTQTEVTPVNEWIRLCELTWRDFHTDSREQDVIAAREFEVNLHKEWLPPLSRI